jgi:hypothetical protein
MQIPNMRINFRYYALITFFIFVLVMPVSALTNGIGIFRPSTGFWYLDSNGDHISDIAKRFGGNGDIPLTGDWNGDNVTDLGIFRPSTGYWYIDTNTDGVIDISERFGAATDKPVPADFNGDGITDIAIFRPSIGYWYIDYNHDGIVDSSFRFGGPNDIPVIGVWKLQTPPIDSNVSIQLIGNVYGISSNTAAGIDQIAFSIGLAPGSTSTDLTKMHIVFATPTTSPITLSQGLTASTTVFTTKSSGGTTAVTSMGPTDQIEIRFMVTPVPANTRITFELRPSIGAALPFSKTVPATIAVTNVLY